MVFPALCWEGQVGMQDPPFCIRGYGILTWAGGSEHPSIIHRVLWQGLGYLDN